MPLNVFIYSSEVAALRVSKHDENTACNIPVQLHREDAL